MRSALILTLSLALASVVSMASLLDEGEQKPRTRILNAGSYAIWIPELWDLGSPRETLGMQKQALAGLNKLEDSRGVKITAFHLFATIAQDAELADSLDEACMVSFYEVKLPVNLRTESYLDKSVQTNEEKFRAGRASGIVKVVRENQIEIVGEFRAAVTDWIGKTSSPLSHSRAYTLQHPMDLGTTAVISTLCAPGAFKNTNLDSVVRSMRMNPTD